MSLYLIARGTCRALVKLLIVAVPVATAILACYLAGGDPAL